MTKLLLKRKILRFAEDGLVKYCDMPRRQARDLVSSSNLVRAIDRSPDIVAHYSQEQLVSYIIKK